MLQECNVPVVFLHHSMLRQRNIPHTCKFHFTAKMAVSKLSDLPKWQSLNVIAPLAWSVRPIVP